MIYNYHKVLNLIQQFQSTGKMPIPPDGVVNAYIIVEKRIVSSDASKFDAEIHRLWLCTARREALEYAHELGYMYQDHKHLDTFYAYEGDSTSEMHLSISGIEAEQSWEEGVLSAGLYAWVFSKTNGEPFLDSEYAKLFACELGNRL